MVLHDIRADNLSPGGASVILQMGQNKGASQSGMTFGSMRHAGDLNVANYDPYASYIYH